MNLKEKVLATLKPKAASLGFTAEELASVVDALSQNLEEDATEEQLGVAVDNALPFLKLSQSAATRIVNASKEKAKSEQHKGDNGKKPVEKSENAENVLLQAIQELKGEVSALKNDKLTSNRLEKFSAVLKDVPEIQKNAMIADFNRITFENDEDFDGYLKEKENLVPSLVQAGADGKLEKGTPPGGGSGTKSDAEAFADRMKEINKKE